MLIYTEVTYTYIVDILTGLPPTCAALQPHEHADTHLKVSSVGHIILPLCKLDFSLSLESVFPLMWGVVDKQRVALDV